MNLVEHMTDQGMADMGLMMVFMWVVLFALGALFLATVLYLVRRVPAGRYGIDRLAGASDLGLRPSAPPEAGKEDAGAQDTIFVLPDISHYTRFMTGSHFAFAHAQHIVLSLIKAMTDAATETLEFSKLEGDAALFFVDAKRHSSQEIGDTVIRIFGAFFRERTRLAGSNLCPCRACNHIRDLDLKVFVHRGKAARFQFRGSVDLFGTDVIVLHRLMKNGVRGHRYVMVTDAASGHVQLPASCTTSRIEEEVEHVGNVSASVYEIDDTQAEELAGADPAPSLSPGAETLCKLRENARSVGRALRSVGKSA